MPERSPLVASQGHLSREEMAVSLRSHEPRVSISTVYRFVHVLVEIGIAREIRIGETSRFELALGRDQHAHLVCEACEGIVEFHDEEPCATAERIARANGFLPGVARPYALALRRVRASSLGQLSDEVSP
jgi:Fur family transcriptional regulator, ferric uptake regulator